MLVLLGDQDCPLQRKLEMGRRRLGDQGIGRPADQVGNARIRPRRRARSWPPQRPGLVSSSFSLHVWRLPTVPADARRRVDHLA
jgi:hypothetical protein